MNGNFGIGGDALVTVIFVLKDPISIILLARNDIFSIPYGFESKETNVIFLCI